VNLETGLLEEIGLDYNRTEKTDEKQPKREGFGLAENPKNGKIILSGGYNISGNCFEYYRCSIWLVKTKDFQVTIPKQL